MTVFVNAATEAAVDAFSTRGLGASGGVILVLLLLALLIRKETIRARGGLTGTRWSDTADAVIPPLLVAFLFNVCALFITFLGHG